MIVHDVEQGSKEWMRLRLGMPTSSRFKDILTNKTLKPAKGDAYLVELLTEWALGCPLEGGSSGWMARGSELEEQGRIAYSYEVGPKPTPVGFVTTDDGLVGCSPDGLVGADGGLEIKFPSAVKHVRYLLNPDALVNEYRHQVQGCLFVTGRPWWHLVSFHAGDDPLPKVLVRCGPDLDWQEAFAPALEAFLARLDAGKEALRSMGVGR